MLPIVIITIGKKSIILPNQDVMVIDYQDLFCEVKTLWKLIEK